MVRLDETYGGNVTTLAYSGIGSYELDMATYSPPGIVLSNDGNSETTIQLNSETYRKTRNGEMQGHEYKKFQDEDGNV